MRGSAALSQVHLWLRPLAQPGGSDWGREVPAEGSGGQAVLALHEASLQNVRTRGHLEAPPRTAGGPRAQAGWGCPLTELVASEA